MDEDQNYGEDVENIAQDQIAEEPKVELKSELDALKAELEAIKTQQFYTQTQVKEEPKAPQFTAQDIEAFQKNPALLAQWLQKQTVEATSEIKKEAQKQVWDSRAYEKFPVLKTDEAFKKRVTAQMREFIAQKEYGKDDPMLLYRAAQIVAADYAPQAKKAQSNTQTSVESRVQSQSRDSQVKSKISNNDPRVRMAMAMGIQGEKLESFKAKLGPYVPSSRMPKMRSLSK